jgi:hypothetical protein
MMRLSLLILRASDPALLTGFYQALGLQFKLEKHGNGPDHYAAIGEGFTLEIYPGAAAPAPIGGFSVSDITSFVQVVLANGGIVKQGPDYAVVTDPSGNRFIVSRHQ